MTANTTVPGRLGGVSARRAALAPVALAAAVDFARAVARRFDARTIAVSLVLLACMVAITGYAMLPQIWGASLPTLKARLFTTTVTCAMVIVAIVAADEAVDRGVPRWQAYPIAVLGAALVGAPLGYELRGLAGFGYGPNGRDPINVNAAFPLVRRLDVVLIVVLVGGLATFVHSNRRMAIAARRRQAEAERARAAAQRRTLESQLQELQARVEPAFLFSTLDRIRQLYRLDAGEGSAMLEHLIAYLRAALPHMRESTSTVAREATLARSWFEIVSSAAPDLTARFDIEPASANARLPALMLLPLLQQAIERPGDADLATRMQMRAPADRVELRVQALAGRLTIEMTTSTEAFAFGIEERAVLAEIAARLKVLYGDDARFECARSGAVDVGGSVATIELPLALADEKAAP